MRRARKSSASATERLENLNPRFTDERQLGDRGNGGQDCLSRCRTNIR
jgi:hypothetical protein